MRSMKILFMLVVLFFPADDINCQTYTVVDTGQIRCYDDRTEIAYPKAGSAFFGQDAQYNGNPPKCPMALLRRETNAMGGLDISYHYHNTY